MENVLKGAFSFNNNVRDELLKDECSFKHEIVNYRSPIIETQLYGFSFPALIDTGSEISAVSEDVWNSFSDKIKSDIPSFPCSGIRVIGAFKSKQRKIQLQTLICFSCENNIFYQEFFVIPDLVYSIILGIDFLRKYKVRIDLNINKIFCSVDDEEIALSEKIYSHEYDGRESLNLRSLSKYESFVTANAVVQSTDIQSVTKNTNLSFDEKHMFKELISEFESIFSNIPGRVKNYNHQIKLHNTDPFFIKSYPIPVAYREAVNKTVTEMENLGIIERAATPYISPVRVVIKKDNSVRICLDARRLNKQMEKDHECPRSIEEIFKTCKLNSSSELKYFSRLDTTSGYWQIPLTEDSKQYTGFRINSKTYVFRVLPFGLSTAASSFIRMISKIFGPEFDSFLTGYIDDMLIISDSFEQHIKHLKMVFKRLQEFGLTLNISKCDFFCDQLNFLGYVINSNGIKPNPSRVKAIVEYTRPHNVKQLQRFLGLCNFDRSFCKSFSSFCEPLTKLLRKTVRWEWKEPQEKAFEKIKDLLINAAMLYHPVLSAEWHVNIDASEYGLGAQLYQVLDGESRTIAYASRLLLPRETRYHSNEKEVLACVFALTRWRVYLLGRHFTVHTDNKALTYINTCRLLSPRIARWVLALQEFDFSIEHISGKDNIVADALSRDSAKAPPYPENRLFKILSTLKLPTEFLRKIKAIAVVQRDDKKLNDIISALSCDVKLQERFALHQDVLYYRQASDEPYLVCVPKVMQSDFVEAYHEMLGHYGVYKTWSALRTEVWWTNMYATIKKILRHCDVCQKTKISRMPKPPINPIIPDAKGDLVALDLYGPLPRGRAGAKYVLVVLDVFTKYIALYPLKNATTRAALNRLILDYFPKNGRPNRILSDHGSQFTSKRWRETLESLGIKVIFNSIRHPQANSSERVMRELGRLCRVYCAGQHTRWAHELKRFAVLMNFVVHESTGFTPHELQRNTTVPKFLPSFLSNPIGTQDVSSERKMWLAKETLQSRAARRAINYPSRPYPVFEEGDLVLLRSSNISSALSAETKKFLLLFEGPYRIKSTVSFNTYMLEHPESSIERGLFHVSHLKAYHPP